MWSGVTAALLSPLPALLTWWWGRGLIRLADDAALPERLTVYRTRLGQLMVGVGIALGMLVPEQAWWAVSVMILATLAAGYPARRVLFGDEGGVGAHVSQALRLWLGLGGFWTLLLVAPALVPADGSARWPVAGGLLALLLVWEAYYGELLLRLLRASPLDRPDLEPRFQTVLARARVASPRLYRTGATGGRWANALALPDVHGTGGVLFSHTLLELLPADEVAAIFAHEVAHLEHHDRRRIRRTRLLVWLAIAAGTLGVPALAAWGLRPGVAQLGWLLLLLSAMLLRLGLHRAHEAASDRRAVELCGDPAGLGRALVKLHALGRVPRRWALDVERAATHPSLAHRLQALGAAGDTLSPPSPGSTVVASPKAGVFLILDADRVHRLDGVPAGTPAEPASLRQSARKTETTAYADLTELRVRAGLSGSAALVGTACTGASWSVPLWPDAVGTVQAALDGIDARLARGPAGVLHHPRLPLLLVLATLAFGWPLSGLFPILVTVVALLVRPGPAPLAAFGAVALAGALHVLLGPPDGNAAIHLGIGWPGGTAALAGAALGLAWLRIRGGERSRAGALVAGAGLGLVALLASLPLLGAAASSGGALRLHQTAQGATAVTVAGLGLAALLGTAATAATRASAVAVALLAVLPLGLASEPFAERFVRDPLLAAAPRLVTTEGTLHTLHRRRLAASAGDLRLSPSGLGYAVRVWPGSARRPTHLVGRVSGGGREVEAVDVAFVGDERLLALAVSDGVPALRMARTDDPETIRWGRVLPALEEPRLRVDAAAEAWVVAGTDLEARELVLVAGRAGEDRIGETRLRLPEQADPEDLAYLPTATTALALETRFEEPMAAALLPRLATLWGLFSPVYPVQSRLWRLAPRDSRPLLSSGLDVHCLGPGRAGEAVACVAVDGGRSWIWRVDSTTGDRECVGWLPGSLRGVALDGHGGLALRGAAELALVELPTGRVRRYALPGEGRQLYGLALASGRIGALSRQADGTYLTIYETR